MTITRRQLLILLPAAAIAWESVLAGTPEASPNYNMTDHWWGMLIDITKCIGCGTCVRPARRRTTSPTATSAPGSSATTWPTGTPRCPKSIRPMAAITAFLPAKEEGGKNFFVPKLCNHCADSPCTQVCPVGATFVTPDGVVMVDQTYCLGCRYCIQACPYGCRFLNPENQHGRQVHAVLPPHYQGTDHRLLRNLSHGRAPVGGLEESQRSDPRIS